MSDDLDRRLDDLYRGLDDSAHRVESRWRSRPGTRRRTSTGPRTSVAAWLGAAVAAAAALLIMILSLRSERKPAPETLVRVPLTMPDPVPRRDPDHLPPLPVATARMPATPPVEPPRPLETAPAPKPPEERAKPPPPLSVPAPEPKQPEAPPPTRVVRASVALRETDGAFELADRPLRGKQKDLAVAAGDRLRTSTAVKITLADDRAILLAPHTVVEFRPEEKRLALSLEQGELLADLNGPGPEIRVLTKACEITPLGTVFSVRIDGGRSAVAVEKGRVEVQSARGKATLRPAEAIKAAEDGTLGPVATADFRTPAWARGHRAAELSLYVEEFSKPGAWEAEIDKGVARALPRPGTGPMIHLAADKPLFEIPLRGTISIVCRADRTSKLKLQIFAGDLRITYKAEVPVNRGSEWRTVVFNVDDLQPTDRTKASGRPAPGAPVSDLLLMYGEEDERGSFWVDSIKVTELRP